MVRWVSSAEGNCCVVNLLLKNMRLTSASVLWAPIASSVGLRAAVAAADAEAEARGTTAYEYLRADQRKDLPPKLTHHHEGDQHGVDDAEKTTKSAVDLTDADNDNDVDAEILLSDDATTRTVDAGVLPRAAPPGGTDNAHWSAVQPRQLKAAKDTKAPKQARKAPKQAKGGAPGCAEGFCKQLGGSGFYGNGTCPSLSNAIQKGFVSLYVSVTLDVNDDAPDTSWVLKRDRDDKVIRYCSLDSDQCQSPSSFTGGATLSTTLSVDPNECYTATMYSCSGKGLYGTGSWSVAFNGTPTFGSNTTFSAESISVGDCDDD